MKAFVDAHCHIDLYEQPERIVALAEERQIYTIAVTNAPSVFLHTLKLTRNSKYVRAAIGLHPELVFSHKSEIDLFREYLTHTRYVGEVGLDYTTPDEVNRRDQRAILSKVADWVSESGDKVLTVHSRRAANDVISILGDAKAKIVLHWFSGNTKECDRAIERGFFFSVNSAMMKSEAARRLIRRIPRDHVITETDGPFIKDGRSDANPVSVLATVAAIAELWDLPTVEAQNVVLDNFKHLVTC